MTSDTLAAFNSAPPSTLRRRSSPALIAAAALLLLGVFLLLWHGPLPFESLIRTFSRIDTWQNGQPLADNPVTLRRFYSLSLATLFLLAGLALIARSAWALVSESVRTSAFNLSTTLACSFALVIYLFRMGYDGPWLPVGVLMRNPAALPVFGHRLLFVWVADALHTAVPNLSPLQCFFLSQCLAILLAVYALGRWSQLLIGPALRWAGQLLGVVMLSTTFDYFTFYDIGIVFFTTCGLIALHTRRLWWLVPVILLGTLNHEGILLLIPLAALVLLRTAPLRTWLPPVAAAFLAYIAVRIVMQTAMPFPHPVEWRLWSNMTKPFLFRREMATSLLAIAGWYTAVFMSLRYCPPAIRRLTLLLPLLLAVNFVFGQFHEGRVFDAFIPVAVAVILIASRQKLALESRTRPTHLPDPTSPPQPFTSPSTPVAPSPTPHTESAAA